MQEPAQKRGDPAPAPAASSPLVAASPVSPVTGALFAPFAGADGAEDAPPTPVEAGDAASAIMYAQASSPQLGPGALRPGEDDGAKAAPGGEAARGAAHEKQASSDAEAAENRLRTLVTSVHVCEPERLDELVCATVSSLSLIHI